VLFFAKTLMETKIAANEKIYMIRIGYWKVHVSK
jgi:hypothetical protein